MKGQSAAISNTFLAGGKENTRKKSAIKDEGPCDCGDLHQ
jgi:hypothetical protein